VTGLDINERWGRWRVNDHGRFGIWLAERRLRWISRDWLFDDTLVEAVRHRPPLRPAHV